MTLVQLGKLTLCAAVFASYAAIGLSASRFEGLPRLVRNGLEPLPGEGFRAASPGLARTGRPPGWLRAAIEDSAVEVELGVRSRATRQCGPARIFSISKNTSLRNLTIAQNESDLVVRLRTIATSLNGEPAYTIPSIFSDQAPHAILLRIEEKQFKLEVDGRQVLHDELPAGALSSWDPSYEVFLANEAGGQRPWLGEIYRASVRVRGERVEYGGRERPSIPRRYWALGPAPPCAAEREDGKPSATWILSGRRWRDLWVNLLGFAPLALMLALMWNGLSVAAIALLCGGLSLAIETGQVYVLGRNPSLGDLLFNIAGAALGALIGRMMTAGARRRAPS